MGVDILCIGEPMIELNQHEKNGPYHPGFGGDTSNAAVAAARHGAGTGLFTGLGRDVFAQSLRQMWSEENVDVSMSIDMPDASTGIYFVTHDENGHAFSYRRAGSASSRITPAELPSDNLKSAKIVHFSAISQAISLTACDTCLAAAEQVRAAGGLVSYDTNLRLSLWPLPRARAVIDATLKLCDIALPGLDDAQLITGLDDPDAIADRLLGYGARIVALTMGADGVLTATPDHRERLSPHDVKLVDATGAGDAFDGAFLAEYLETGDPFAAARYANAAAALSVTGFGAIAPLPTRKEVAAFLTE